MRFELSIAKGPKQRLFYSYLNAVFLDKMVKAEAQFEPGCSARLTTTLLEAGTEIELEWQFETLGSGELSTVEVISKPAEGGAISSNWESLVSNIIHGAVLSAFNEKRLRTHARCVLFYIGPQLDGEYWYRRVRISPLEADQITQPAFVTERAVALDFQIYPTDRLDATSLAAEFCRCAAARLALLLDIDFYEMQTQKVWIYLAERKRSERHQRGFYDAPAINQMPAKGDYKAGSKGPSIQTFGRLSGPLKMPAETRQILKAIESSDEHLRRKFDAAARLYQIGLSLTPRFPTAALAYRVATMETLQLGETKEGVSNFMREHLGDDSSVKILSDYLVERIRNAHFHAGKFGLGEFNKVRDMDTISDFETVNQKTLQLRCMLMTRLAIANWIISKTSLTDAPPK